MQKATHAAAATQRQEKRREPRCSVFQERAETVPKVRRRLEERESAFISACNACCWASTLLQAGHVPTCCSY